MILRSGGLPWRRLLTAALAVVAIVLFWTQLSERGGRPLSRDQATTETRDTTPREPGATRGWGTSVGFADARRHDAPGARHFRKTADRLGVIQIDSVNVVTRTHYLPKFSRLGDYARDTLETEAWGRKPSLFEYWGHEASLLPMSMYPLMRWRMALRLWQAGTESMAACMREW